MEFFESKYTGEEVEEKLDNSTLVKANESEYTATENLEELQVGNKNYKVSNVESINIDDYEVGYPLGWFRGISLNGTPLYLRETKVNAPLGVGDTYSSEQMKTLTVGGVQRRFPYVNGNSDSAPEQARQFIKNIMLGDAVFYNEDSDFYRNEVIIKNYVDNPNNDAMHYIVNTSRSVKNSGQRVLGVINPVSGIYGIGGSLRMLKYDSSRGTLMQGDFTSVLNGGRIDYYPVADFSVTGVYSGNTYTFGQNANEPLSVYVVLFNR